MSLIQDQCQTIDEVLQTLRAIIDHSIQKNSKAGYFAMMYYCVTARVKEGIQNNEFEDGPRMERLDVLFANLYLQAWNHWQRNERSSLAWQAAFAHTTASSSIILQHLLLGMNAHINLDLGIATAQTMKGQDIHLIKNDFDRINAILRVMADKVQDKLSTVSPLLRLLDWYGKQQDEMLADFSIRIARDGAWRFAQELSGKSAEAQSICVLERDQQIAALASLLAKPAGRLFRMLLQVVQLSERRQPSEAIPLLKIG